MFSMSKNSEPLLNKIQSGNSIIDEDDENNDSYSERMIAERRVSITWRAAQAIAKAASNGSSSDAALIRLRRC